MSKKRIFTAIIAVVLTMLCIGMISANAQKAVGATFSETDYYKAHLALDNLPSTYEAFISFPENTNPGTVGGVIFGNYKNNSTAGFSFEISTKGNPRLFIIDDNKKQYDFTFGKVNVYTGKTLHLAITKDSSKDEIICYVDGVAVQTLKAASPASITINSPTILGGDYRTGNTNYFKGTISKFAIYYNVRTPDQIKVDSMGKYGTNKLAGVYEVEQGKKLLESIEFSLIRFVHSEPWVEKEPAKNYAYSFAVVGDTQILTMSYQSDFVKLYDWIKNNAESKKIKYVFGLGDITNNDTAGEWQTAKKFMTGLNGVVPYSFVRGNHDSVDQYNRYFSYSEFSSTIDGSYDESMLNTYTNFEVGDVKYMIMCLDYLPSVKVLQWADKVAEENPDRNIIVTTHAYLYDNNAKNNDMWDSFVKKHENICMVISGHDPTDLIISRKAMGSKGNTVTEFLVDPQNVDRYTNGMGLVAMLYFSEDGRQVQIEYICVTNDKYYLAENQYTTTVDMLKTADDDVSKETEDSAETKAPETTLTDVTVVPGKNNNLVIYILIAVGTIAVAAAVSAVILSKDKKKK